MMKAREVWDEQEERRLYKMSAMKPVIAQIEGKVRQQAIMNANAPYILFEVPSFVFGYQLSKPKSLTKWFQQFVYKGNGTASCLSHTNQNDKPITSHTPSSAKVYHPK